MSDKPAQAEGVVGAPAGFSMKQWAEQAGIAFSTYYLIPQELRPRHVRVGRRVIIIEPAKAWLERMAIAGQVVCISPLPSATEASQQRRDARPRRKAVRPSPRRSTRTAA